MKTRNIYWLLVIMLGLLQGCIPSLHPLHTENKLVFKTDLMGIWMDKNTEDEDILISREGVPQAEYDGADFPGAWIFEPAKNKSYRLIYIDEKEVPAFFEAHLVKLGKNYFFNFFPSKPTKNEERKYNMYKRPTLNELDEIHHLPVNTFAKVTFEGELITIALFDGQFMEDLLEQKRIRIKHEKTPQGYVLTAEPKELQNFFIKYGDNEKAFSEPFILKRQL